MTTRCGDGCAGEDALAFTLRLVGNLVGEGDAADGGLEAFGHFVFLVVVAGPMDPGKPAAVLR